MSEPRDLVDLLYPGVTLNSEPLSEEMIKTILAYAEELLRQNSGGADGQEEKE